MTTQYRVRIRGRAAGPFPLEVIRQLVRRGQVGRAHEVSLDGVAWAPAASFPEIFAGVSPAPPVPQAEAAPSARAEPAPPAAPAPPPVPALPSPSPAGSPMDLPPARGGSGWTPGIDQVISVFGVGLAVLAAGLGLWTFRGRPDRGVPLVVTSADATGRSAFDEAVEPVPEARESAADAEPAGQASQGSWPPPGGFEGSTISDEPAVVAPLSGLSAIQLPSARNVIRDPQDAVRDGLAGGAGNSAAAGTADGVPAGIPAFDPARRLPATLASWEKPAAVTLLSEIDLVLPMLDDMPDDYRLVLTRQRARDTAGGMQVVWHCGTADRPTDVGTFTLSGTSLSFAYTSQPMEGRNLMPLVPLRMVMRGSGVGNLLLTPRAMQSTRATIRGDACEIQLATSPCLPAEVCAVLTKRLWIAARELHLAFSDDVAIDAGVADDASSATPSALTGNEPAEVWAWWRPRMPGGMAGEEPREPIAIAAGLRPCVAVGRPAQPTTLVMRPSLPVIDPMPAVLSRVDDARLARLLQSLGEPFPGGVGYDTFIDWMSVHACGCRTPEDPPFGGLRSWLRDRSPAQPTYDGLVAEIRDYIASRPGPTDAGAPSRDPASFRRRVERPAIGQARREAGDNALIELWRMLHVYGILRRAGLPSPRPGATPASLRVCGFQGQAGLRWEFATAAGRRDVALTTLVEIAVPCDAGAATRTPAGRPRAVFLPTIPGRRLDSPPPGDGVEATPAAGSRP